MKPGDVVKVVAGNFKGERGVVDHFYSAGFGTPGYWLRSTAWVWWEPEDHLRPAEPYQRVDAGPNWGVPAPGGKHG